MKEILLILKMDFRKSFSSSVVLIGGGFVALTSILTKNYSVAPPIILFMLVTLCYTYDTSTGYARLVHSLPVKRSSVVIARYIHSLAFLGFIWIISILSYSPEMTHVYTFSIPYFMFVMTVYISFIIPFCLNESKLSSAIVVMGYLLTLWLTSLLNTFCEFFHIDGMMLGTNMGASTSFILSATFMLISFILSLIFFEKHLPKEGVLE